MALVTPGDSAVGSTFRDQVGCVAAEAPKGGAEIDEIIGAEIKTGRLPIEQIGVAGSAGSGRKEVGKVGIAMDQRDLVLLRQESVDRADLRPMLLPIAQKAAHRTHVIRLETNSWA